MTENVRIDMGGETAGETGTGTARDHQGVKEAAAGTTTDLLAAIVTSSTTDAGVEAADVALVVGATGRGRGTATRTNSGTSGAVVIRRHLRRESLPRT